MMPVFPQSSKLAKNEEIDYEMADKLFFTKIETRKFSNMWDCCHLAGNEDKWWDLGDLT